MPFGVIPNDDALNPVRHVGENAEEIPGTVVGSFRTTGLWAFSLLSLKASSN